MKINPWEITPEHVYLSRRKFLTGMGALVAGTLFYGACRGPDSSQPTEVFQDDLTPFDSIINYNNYYEFTTSKQGVANLA